MTFAPKMLLTAPLVDMTIDDDLVVALAKLQAMSMGGAGVTLPGGASVRKINLVAHGEQAAYFMFTDGACCGSSMESSDDR